MPWTRIDNVGDVGVIKDTGAPKLPLGAWTDALNVRFLDGSAMQSLGHGSIYDGAPVTPLHVLPVYLPGSLRYWLYASATKLYAVSAATGSVVHTDLTKQSGGVDVAYGGAANKWTSGSLSGIPFFNNGVDAPQRWNMNLASRFADLDAWPSGMTCKSLRAFKNQLVALNVTKSGTALPYMVKWSTEADPGTVPQSWDETDPTKDAGEVDLAEGGDPIIDGMQLGGTFMVYKEHSAWRMDYTGGQFVEQFTKVGGISGAMNLNCIVEVEIGGAPMHVVLTNDDVVAHDGQSARSILDRQARRSLFLAIDAQNTGLCFVFKNPFLNEVWVCYPEGGFSQPNKALVWNYSSQTVSFRELPSINHANFGPLESSVSQPWDADSAPWDADVSGWSSAEFTPDASRVLMAANNGKLYLLDSSTTFDGVLPTSYLERRALQLAPPGRRTLIKRILPRISGATGQQLTIRAGGADDPYSDPTYSAQATFTMGSSIDAPVLADARFPAIRIEAAAGNYAWRLDGLDIEWEPAGYF